jgi:hypothetical protein
MERLIHNLDEEVMPSGRCSSIRVLTEVETSEKPKKPNWVPRVIPMPEVLTDVRSSDKRRNF